MNGMITCLRGAFAVGLLFLTGCSRAQGTGPESESAEAAITEEEPTPTKLETVSPPAEVVFDPATFSQVEIGMDKDQVRALLGKPVMDFQDGEVVYLTLDPSEVPEGDLDEAILKLIDQAGESLEQAQGVTRTAVPERWVYRLDRNILSMDIGRISVGEAQPGHWVVVFDAADVVSELLPPPAAGD